MAVALSNTEMMGTLLSSGADPNARTTETEWASKPCGAATPLHYAIRYCADDDDKDICNTFIRLVLDAGADPYANPYAPFNLACHQRDPSIAQLILQLRPLPCPPPDGNRLLYNVVDGLGLSTLRLTTDSLSTLRLSTRVQGHLNILKAVLASDPTLTLNTHDDGNNIPPVFYMLGLTPEIARGLLELGQDPNITGHPPLNSSLLHKALRGGPEVVKVFLDAGADPTGGPNVNDTPLHRLAGHYHQTHLPLRSMPTLI
ncbi:hypothetical protein HK104_010685 [Borealophlyctis nickersoniae]|nr:hypothetical protein HK104_010685 [Borealophlyctis nickersoniae]